MIEILIPDRYNRYSTDLSEHKLELWMYDHPEILFQILGPLKWIAKEYKVPSGIIDLLGMTEKDKFLILVELKISDFREEYISQVARYAKDLEDIQDQIFQDDVDRFVIKILIATGTPSKQVQFAANALSVYLLTINIEGNKIDIPGSFWRWTPEYKEWITYQIKMVSKDQIFAPLINSTQSPEGNTNA